MSLEPQQFIFKIPFLKLGNRGVGETARDLVCIHIHSENGMTKTECVRGKGCVWGGPVDKRKLQRRGKHMSQLGRQGSRKALGEDPLSLPRSLEFTYPQIPSPTLLITTRSGPWELNTVANPAEGALCQYTVRLGYVCRD